MKHETNNTVPDQPPTQGFDPEYSIGFALAVPVTPEIGMVFPPGNTIGVALLSSAVGASLQARGIGFEGNVAGVELNQALGFYQVTRRLAGLQAIQATLDKFFLLPFAAIGWVDVAEGIWRCYYPQGCPVDVGAFFKHGRLDAMCLQSEHRLAQVKRWMAEQGLTP